ncbi:MAG TPA: ParB/RepB/Spo0J family partition protein, partial [Oscillospiraceae bacterium]|nr:ParB/RepB/Spo0J family partition protein [Oscillospiraceae bacterium]
MGLDALFSDNSSEVQAKQTLRINEIEPNKSQPRTDFDEQSIASLADSIREHGLLQPILVRPLQNGGYQIVAGERRWRACRMLGMSEVPVLIRELSDRETAQIALIENLQRENLNPVEEAAGYKDLMEKYGM